MLSPVLIIIKIWWNENQMEIILILSSNYKIKPCHKIVILTTTEGDCVSTQFNDCSRLSNFMLLLNLTKTIIIWHQSWYDDIRTKLVSTKFTNWNRLVKILSITITKLYWILLLIGQTRLLLNWCKAVTSLDCLFLASIFRISYVQLLAWWICNWLDHAFIHFFSPISRQYDPLHS